MQAAMNFKTNLADSFVLFSRFLLAFLQFFWFRRLVWKAFRFRIFLYIFFIRFYCFTMFFSYLFRGFLCFLRGVIKGGKGGRRVSHKYPPKDFLHFLCQTCKSMRGRKGGLEKTKKSKMGE